MARKRLVARLAAASLAVTLVAACSSDSTDGAAKTTTTTGSSAPTTNQPTGDSTLGAGGVTDWPEAKPADAGLDQTVLGEMATDAEDAGSHCLLVARHGRIVGEWYFGQGGESSPSEVFSATKSFTAVLVGIAQDEGHLDIDDPADTYLTEWKDTPSAEVDVKHLLSNDSGRFWSAQSDYGDMVRSRDMNEYAIDLEQAAPPGTVWAYNNAAIQTLSPLLERATGTEFEEYGKTRLLDRIGMNDSEFKTDGAGNGLAFMGLWSTCRDMARFGQLLLNEGDWNGEQVVSQAYLEEATSAPSQDLNAAYGYLFWLNKKGPIAGALSPTTAEEVSAREDSQLVTGRPEDLVFAQGLGGQMIQIDHETDTVVVRLGPPNMAAPYGPTQTSRVLDAIED